jgi:hypothetical protein
LNKTQQLSATKQTFEPANLRDLTLQVIRELKKKIKIILYFRHFLGKGLVSEKKE